MSAVTSQLPAIVITGSSSPYTARIQPSKEDRMHFLLSKHPRLLFRNVSSPSNSGSSSPTSSTSSSDLSASSIDALLAAELESPACPDATKSWIKSALGMEADTGTDAGDVDVRELCVEASPADSTDSFQSLMSAVSGMFGETEPLEVGPTSMDGRWPYIFKVCEPSIIVQKIVLLLMSPRISIAWRLCVCEGWQWPMEARYCSW